MKKLQEETYNFLLLSRHDKQIITLSGVMSQNTTNDDDMITGISQGTKKLETLQTLQELQQATDETLNFYCLLLKHLARLQSSNKEFAQLDSFIFHISNAVILHMSNIPDQDMIKI